ncbi:hypothetical protein ACFX2I_016885 [Malus domestica]
MHPTGGLKLGQVDEADVAKAEALRKFEVREGELLGHGFQSDLVDCRPERVGGRGLGSVLGDYRGGKASVGGGEGQERGFGAGAGAGATLGSCGKGETSEPRHSANLRSKRESCRVGDSNRIL